MRNTWLTCCACLLLGCDSTPATNPTPNTSSEGSESGTTSASTNAGNLSTDTTTTSSNTASSTSGNATASVSDSNSTTSATSMGSSTSTGGAASTSDSASSSSGGGGTSSADPCDTAIFCEDFESYTVGQAPAGAWSTQTNSGSVSIDDSRQVSGSKSARFVTEASSNSKTAYLHLEDAFPVANNVYYGRMLFWLESAPTESVHWTFIQGGGTVPGESYRALYRYGGQHPVDDGNQLMANYETPDSYSGNGPASDCWKHAQGVVVPVGRWSCVEWKFDGVADEMRLWLDGVAIDSLTVEGSGEGCVSSEVGNVWTAPNFEYLDIGWESYQADETRTLFIDDLVLDDEPIGCPQLP